MTAPLAFEAKSCFIMCRPDGSLKTVSNGENSNHSKKSLHQHDHDKREATPVTNNNPATWKCVVAAAILPPLTAAFASWFPFVIPYTHAPLYYQQTSYVYDAEHTKFDNTPLTYVTDYLVALWMLWGCIDMYRISQQIALVPHQTKGRNWDHLKSTAQITSMLLGSYAISVIFGGVSHQFFVSLEMLNTLAFRIMWSVTVGMVTAASGFIGAIGSYFALYFKPQVELPIMPNWFWAYFGFYLTLVCWAGGMSFYRPAVDIFIAGTAQFTPTMYTVLVILTRKYETESTLFTKSMQNGNPDSTKNPLLPASGAIKTAPVKQWIRIFFVVAFFLNAPLLPVYPEMLWNGLELGVVNAILHSNLALAWGLQYLSIKWICESQLSDVTK